MLANAIASGLQLEDQVGYEPSSADRVNTGWTAAQRARERGLPEARSHIERLPADLPPRCALVTVLDGHPATLGWLGAVHGHRTRSLGIEHFGQTGSIADLYRHYGIDINAIITAAQALTPGTPIRLIDTASLAATICYDPRNGPDRRPGVALQ
jgi:pyruvate dehydrogenase E1 component